MSAHHPCAFIPSTNTLISRHAQLTLSVSRFLMRELQPSVKFSSFIVIEPGISQKNNPDTNAATSSLIAWTWLRKDTWTSRKSAKKDLEAQILYATWDPRVLESYIVSPRRLSSFLTFGVLTVVNLATWSENTSWCEIPSSVRVPGC